jgi:hypothetical protein
MQQHEEHEHPQATPSAKPKHAAVADMPVLQLQYSTASSASMQSTHKAHACNRSCPSRHEHAARQLLHIQHSQPRPTLHFSLT